MKEEVKPVAERDIVTTFEAIENNLTEMRIRLSLVPGTLATTLLAIMPNIFRREGAA